MLGIFLWILIQQESIDSAIRSKVAFATLFEGGGVTQLGLSSSA
jgi:hypothetical protein